MEKLLNCPICSNKADWIEYTEPSGIAVYFCMDCVEHFTAEDTTTSMIKRAKTNAVVIDSLFVKMNNLRNSFR